MKLTELLSAWMPVSTVDCNITGLRNDSRQIKSGDLFIAYPGAVVDGRQYIRQAIQAGAAAVVYDPVECPDKDVLLNEIPCLPMSNLASQLGAIANRFYDYPSRTLEVTGVTGTNGKTTIAYQLAQAHGLLGRKSAYVGTLGQGDVHALQPLMNTTPDALCLQQLFYDYNQRGVKRVCMEVSSHALSQGRVAQIDFNQAIYTNLSHEHLDYHQTMALYAEAKAILFSMPTLKWAVINQDDAYGGLMGTQLPEQCQKLTYGMSRRCDIWASNIKISMTGSTFDVATPWGMHHIYIKALGSFNVYNSLAVFSSLLAYGYRAIDVVPVMAKLQASPGRMEVVLQEPCVIVDYAHTPDALENVLTTLVQLKAAASSSAGVKPGRLWVVFGCGGDRDKTKRSIMGRIASQYADVVILTSDNPRTEEPSSIIADIAMGVSARNNAITLIDRAQAIQYALQNASPQDVVLIAGKGHEAYQQIGHERFEFSDQDVVRKSFVDVSNVD